jgi:hypothetical protein
MLFAAWARCLLGALVGVLIALLVVPLIPAPGHTGRWPPPICRFCR